ncbi:thioredoxin family protein [Enterovibrio norvegicus]|uniref:Thiol reductase thioredoxin n=1 Tax=Enterovibrio norvegicus TaxID=188144 RepID=A0A2N7LA60_9GAMM|nr:thioredoxin family protein [Enterovibrio norvegicus]PMN65243.1 thiol reductase thioredoxin [Enterovibrio norvegicus]PMN91465.1 thiol reductase thioredoxin [Enterovibrio norvegicus]
MKASTIGFKPDYDEDAPTIEDVTHLKGLAVIEFGAPWCPHCQGAQDAIKEVLEPTPMLHIKVFDGKGKALGRHFKVKLWPTVILLKDGVEVSRVVRPTETHEVQAIMEEA